MDPSPLLSTTATAAAALVAIVGGLLVSRVVGLATERAGLDQRLDDLRARLRAAEARREDIEDRLLRWDVAEVLRGGQEGFAKGGDPDIQQMIAEADIDRSVDELRPFVEEEAARYRAIRDVLSRWFKDGHPGFTWDEVRDHIDVDHADEDAYEFVWDQLEKENPEPREPDRLGLRTIQPALDPSWRTVAAIRNTAEAAEHATLHRDADQARHQVDALNVQIEQTELAFARVRRPEGVTGGLWVLGYLGAVGTVVPLAVMAWGPAALPGWARAAVVVGFTSGVAALMGYVAVEVHRMTGGKPKG